MRLPVTAAFVALSVLAFAQRPAPNQAAPAESQTPRSSTMLLSSYSSAPKDLAVYDGPKVEAGVYQERVATNQGWGFLYERPSSPTPSTAKEDGPPSSSPTLPPPPSPIAAAKKQAPARTAPYPFAMPSVNQPNNGNSTKLAPPAPADPRLHDGSLLKARLVTAAVVPAGISVPVLVEAKDDDCKKCAGLRFLGDARIMIGGRVELQLKYAVTKGRSYPVVASGFAADDIGYGLKGDVIEEAPSLAADLIRGTLGGVADWTNAALNAQDATITPSGAVAVSKSTPPISSFLAARAANLFSLPQDSKALTRVMVVPAGTPLYVYVENAEAAPQAMFSGTKK